MPASADRLLRSLEWRVARRLEGRLQGSYRTVLRGTGIDLAGLRPYVLEDDARHIDWNVTARLDEPFLRLYTEDRDLTAWLVLDRSASMRFGRGERGKDVTLTELALSLARLLAHGGNRVGAILYDDRDSLVVPPGSGRTQVLRIGHELLLPNRRPAKEPVREQARRTLRRPVQWPVQRPAKGRGSGAELGRTTDVGAMLGLAAATVRRRSLVFVISDFISDGPWERELIRLAHRHEVVALRVLDPAERELPDLGVVVVEDSETGEQLLADTGDPLFRQRLRNQWEAHEARVASSMRRAAVAGRVVRTDEDLVEVFVDLVRRSGRSVAPGPVAPGSVAPGSVAPGSVGPGPAAWSGEASG